MTGRAQDRNRLTSYDQCVCVSVCLHASKTTCPAFMKFSVHIINVATAQSSSDDSAIHCVLWMLWMAMFAHNGPGKDDAIRAYVQSDSPAVSTGEGRNMMSIIAFFNIVKQ